MIQIFQAFSSVLIFNLSLYAACSVGPFLVLWILRPGKLAAREIQDPKLFPGQLQFELKYSLQTMLVVSVMLTPLLLWIQKGVTQIEFAGHFSGWILGPIFLVAFFIQDIWFYWSHRWLHSKWAFPRIHWLHHKSKVPTPLASHSFHWIEATLQYVWLYPLAFLLPMTLTDFCVFMALMHFFATWGHFNFELMPKSVWSHPLGSWVTTSSHHNDHHRYAKDNYGLYLKFWDQKFKTLNSETEKHFPQKF